MNPLLSVIVPAFNVEATIDRCVESILNAGTDRCEVILVDDGSTDSTCQQCDRWAKQDTRIRVIHKSNGGLSDARNAGLSAAQGEYVTFVDSDDFLLDGTYRLLLDILSNHPEYDILEFPVVEFHGSLHQRNLPLGDHVFTDVWEYWLKAKAYAHTYACNKIYRKKLFDDLAFPVGRVFEDAYMLPRLLEKTKVVATTTSGCYYYSYNEKGITATAGGQEWRQLLDSHLYALRHIPAGKDIQSYYLEVLNIQLHTNELTGDAPLLPSLHIRHTLSIRPFILLLKALALNMLGMERLCRLNRCLKKWLHIGPRS